MPTDALAELADLPGVAGAADDARTRVDSLLWDRRLRKVAGSVTKQSVLRGAWASAAMDGAEIPFEAVAAGTFEDSPMGTRCARTVALTAQLPGLVEVYGRSPMQAWAAMNTVLIGGLAPQQDVGRPRPDSDVEDPLRLGHVPTATEAAERMIALADLVVAQSAAPAIVAAGVVHAELAVLRPFRHASGAVARGTIRLSLAARGLDPGLVTMPEYGLWTLGRTRYVRALGAYTAGTPDGVAQWLIWFSEAVKVGAAQTAALVADSAE